LKRKTTHLTFDSIDVSLSKHEVASVSLTAGAIHDAVNNTAPVCSVSSSIKRRRLVPAFVARHGRRMQERGRLEQWHRYAVCPIVTPVSTSHHNGALGLSHLPAAASSMNLATALPSNGCFTKPIINATSVSSCRTHTLIKLVSSFRVWIIWNHKMGQGS